MELLDDEKRVTDFCGRNQSYMRRSTFYGEKGSFATQQSSAEYYRESESDTINAYPRDSASSSSSNQIPLESSLFTPLKSKRSFPIHKSRVEHTLSQLNGLKAPAHDSLTPQDKQGKSSFGK